MTEPQPDQVGGTPLEATYNAAGNVIAALALCIRDVSAVGKDSRNEQQNFNFRGVDAVVNACHPVLARHGVVIVPHKVERVVTAVTSRNGGAGRIVDLELTYRVYGPGGRDDYIDATVMGESADYGDKATAKAFSVAYRIVLLQVLNLPTSDPDPDAGEQFEHVTRRAAATAAVPDLPQDLVDGREAVRGAWAFLYGTFNQREAEAAYTKWNEGGALVEATAPDLRRFAAYLSSISPTEAGGNPADMPAGEAAHPDHDHDTREMTPRMRGQLFVLMGQLIGDDKAEQLRFVNKALGTEYESRASINRGDAGILIDVLKAKGVEVPGGEATQ